LTNFPFLELTMTEKNKKRNDLEIPQSREASVGAMDDELVDPRAAAAFLHIKEQTLAKWRCRKTYGLAYVRVGRLIKYQRRSLIAFIASRTHSGAPEQPEGRATRRRRLRS
jgi:hypothetical protein